MSLVKSGWTLCLHGHQPSRPIQSSCLLGNVVQLCTCITPKSLHNCRSSCVYDIANLWKGCWNNDSPFFGREIGSDRTYFSEGQRYPFGKLSGSCFCCFKTTHQTQWRILENTNNLPQPLSCAATHLCIYTEECTCSHTSVRASRCESNNESRLEEKVKAKEQEASGATEQWVAHPS